MAEIQLANQKIAQFDRSNNPMESVTFAGPCIATALMEAGQETNADGWRMTSILSGFVGELKVAECGAVDFAGNVGHHSSGPASLTVAVPSGYHGKFTVTAGKPKSFRVTLVENG